MSEVTEDTQKEQSASPPPPLQANKKRVREETSEQLASPPPPSKKQKKKETNNVFSNDNDDSIESLYQTPDWEKPVPQKYEFSLEVIKSGVSFETIALKNKGHFIFGREPSLCDIVAAHPTISRQHCVLQHKNNGVSCVFVLFFCVLFLLCVFFVFFWFQCCNL